MEQKKPTDEKTAYTGRFGDSSAAKKGSSAVPRRTAKTADAPRRPTGFSAPTQPARSKKPAGKAEPEKKTGKPKKEKKVRKPRPAREKKNRRGLKVLFAILAMLVVLWLALLLIFGGEEKTIHQLPTIEREGVAAFTPEETPLPGTEVP